MIRLHRKMLKLSTLLWFVLLGDEPGSWRPPLCGNNIKWNKIDPNNQSAFQLRAIKRENPPDRGVFSKWWNICSNPTTWMREYIYYPNVSSSDLHLIGSLKLNIFLYVSRWIRDCNHFRNTKMHVWHFAELTGISQSKPISFTVTKWSLPFHQP